MSISELQHECAESRKEKHILLQVILQDAALMMLECV
jgi:hypothetical protein